MDKNPPVYNIENLEAVSFPKPSPNPPPKPFILGFFSVSCPNNKLVSINIGRECFTKTILHYTSPNVYKQKTRQKTGFYCSGGWI